MPETLQLSRLSEQFEDLLLFLRGKEEQWLASNAEELVGLPDELENRAATLGRLIADLRVRIEKSGYASATEWANAEGGQAGVSTGLISSLKEKVEQTRQLVRIQQLLAKNLVAYTRGITLLSESKQRATYSDRSSTPSRAGRLELQG